MLPYLQYVPGGRGAIKCISISVSANTGGAQPGLVIELLQIYVCSFGDQAFLYLFASLLSLHLQKKPTQGVFTHDQ